MQGLLDLMELEVKVEAKPDLTNLTYEQSVVYTHLGVGEDRAKTKAELIAATGFPARQIRAICAELCEWVNVISRTENGGGYWIEPDSKRVLEFIRFLKSYIKSFTTRIENLEKRIY